jgi:hypothetical protein
LRLHGFVGGDAHDQSVAHGFCIAQDVQVSDVKQIKALVV